MDRLVPERDLLVTKNVIYSLLQTKCTFPPENGLFGTALESRPRSRDPTRSRSCTDPTTDRLSVPSPTFPSFSISSCAERKRERPHRFERLTRKFSCHLMGVKSRRRARAAATLSIPDCWLPGDIFPPHKYDVQQVREVREMRADVSRE